MGIWIKVHNFQKKRVIKEYTKLSVYSTQDSMSRRLSRGKMEEKNMYTVLGCV
jgi:hypothetical protein